jgi:hypothetical protein
MTRQISSFVLLMAGIAAFGQAPQSKPNLSGTWVFDSQKSALKVPGPATMTLQIDQKDPHITSARIETYGDQSFNWKLDADADSPKEIVDTAPNGVTTSSKVYWQGNALILDQKITASDGTKVNEMVTYTLEDNFSTLQAVERQTAVGGKGSTVNKWVYVKKAQ